MTTAQKYNNLTATLKAAKTAADRERNTEDGGTCNFDAPAFDYRAHGMQKGRAIAAIEAAGFSCFDWHLYRKTYLVICGMTAGQADRRSAMAEAFTDAMIKQGYICMMYYAMD